MGILLYLLMSVFASDADSVISENSTSSNTEVVNVGNSIVDDLNGLIR